jgi:nucleotide-binding universal stress UspA family protein
MGASMIKQILVPLDGSQLGETALELASRVAVRMNASITFLHVIEKNAPAEVHGERHLSEVGEATAYLEEIAGRDILSGVPTRMHVHTAEVRDVARSIVEHAEEFAPDLIVMTTHGKRNARQMVVGTVAQQVIGLGRTPVLVVRPTEEASRPSAATAQAGETAETQSTTEAGSLVLLPIDANPGHEGALPLACEYARALRSRIHLLITVPKVGDLRGSESAAALLSPSAMRVRLEMDFERADEYLRDRAAQVAKEGIPVTTECRRGDPANVIVELAGRAQAQVIILGTHGKAGSEAFWNESVAARVVTRAPIPVLLVPVKD